MNVALYARFSSDHQDKSSITDQYRTCETFATREGWMITHRYADEAISGTTADRPQYQQMLKDAKTKRFDVLLVHDFSRLSRDMDETEKTRKCLVHWGIRLIGVQDGIDTNRKGHKLHSRIKGMMNEDFIDKLRDDITRGMVRQALGGFHCGGRTYGYRIDPVEDATQLDADSRPVVVGKKLAINPEQARWVRWIFEKYAEGQSPHKIVSELNRQGVPAPGAAYKRKKGVVRPPTWHTTALHGYIKRGTGLLNNALYIGRQVWNRSRRDKDPETNHRVYIVKDQSEWIPTNAPHLRIIDDDLWARVQARRDAAHQGVEALRATLHSRVRSTGAGPKYLFSGLLVCGSCGGKFVICGVKHYCCSIWRTRGVSVCPNTLKVTRQLVEAVLLATIQTDIFTTEGLELFKQEFIRLLASQRRTRRPDVAKATARLQEVERRLANLVNAVAQGIFSASTKGELDTLEAEKMTLTQTIKGKNKLYEKVISFLPNMEERFTKLIDDLVTVTQQEVDTARRILRELVGGSIRLHPSSDGTDRFLTAELTGDYHGLLKLALGGKLLLNPHDRLNVSGSDRRPQGASPRGSQFVES